MGDVCQQGLVETPVRCSQDSVRKKKNRSQRKDVRRHHPSEIREEYDVIQACRPKIRCFRIRSSSGCLFCFGLFTGNRPTNHSDKSPFFRRFSIILPYFHVFYSGSPASFLLKCTLEPSNMVFYLRGVNLFVKVVLVKDVAQELSEKNNLGMAHPLPSGKLT